MAGTCSVNQAVLVMVIGSWTSVRRDGRRFGCGAIRARSRSFASGR